MTGNGGVTALSTITGMRPRELLVKIRGSSECSVPLGLRRRNQSFFCSLVDISLHRPCVSTVVVTSDGNKH